MNSFKKTHTITFFTFVMALFSSCNDEDIKIMYLNTSPVSIELKVPQFRNSAVNNFYDDELSGCWKVRESYFNNDSLSKKIFQINYPMGRDCNNYVYCNPEKVVDYLDNELLNINKYATDLKHFRKNHEEFTIFATCFNRGFYAVVLFENYWIRLYLDGEEDEDKQLNILNSIKKSNYISAYHNFEN